MLIGKMGMIENIYIKYYYYYNAFTMHNDTFETNECVSHFQTLNN